MSSGARRTGKLADVETGTRVRIAGIAADALARRHLAALGLRAGTVVELVRNLGADGVVVGLTEDRLALPRDLALRIGVEAGEARAPTGRIRPEVRA